MFVLKQEELMLYCLRAGLLGVLFAGGYLLLGFQRILTEKLPKGLSMIIQTVIDLLSWGIVAFADILMVYSANRGRIRILALLVQIVCFLLCYLPLRRVVRKGQTKIFKAMAELFVYPVITSIKKKIQQDRIRRYHKNIDQKMKKDGKLLIDALEKIVGS